MNWDRNRRFDERRGGESYRPMDRLSRPPSRSYVRRARSPPQIRSPRLVADTWVPSNSRIPGRIRSRSPQRRSRSPFRSRDTGYYTRARSPPPRRFSPRRDGRPRSPLQTSSRARSPYLERGSRQSSRGRTPPTRLREASPSQFFGPPKRGSFATSTDNKYAKTLSPPRDGLRREASSGLRAFPRSRSPYHGGYRERRVECTPRRLSPSPPRYTPPVYNSAAGSSDVSRRLPPVVHSESANVAARNTRTRSPGNQSSIYRRYPRPSGTAPSFHERPSLAHSQINSTSEVKPRSSMGRPVTTAVVQSARDLDSNTGGVFRSTESQRPDSYRLNLVHSNNDNNDPNQTRNRCASPGPAPPSGPSHGLKPLHSHNSGNISLLSAPTRPRNGPSFRENSWAGTPPMRRGPVPTVSLIPTPSVRSNIGQTSSNNELHRPLRPKNPTPAGYSHVQKFTNYLTGLSPIIPGGKLLSFSQDPAMEKRLYQLEIDKEKLTEQNTERQRLKRLWIKDWEQLGRESSISALRSELAEGHLQRMAEGESVSGDANF